MKKIYFAHSNDIDYINELYEPLKNAHFLKKYELIFPHELSRNTNNGREFYKDIDIFIAEISIPATGLGIELGWAFDDNKPIFCIHKSNTKVGNSIKSVTDINNIFEYSDIDSMLDAIQNILKNKLG